MQFAFEENYEVEEKTLCKDTRPLLLRKSRQEGLRAPVNEEETPKINHPRATNRWLVISKILNSLSQFSSYIMRILCSCHLKIRIEIFGNTASSWCSTLSPETC